MPAASRFRSTGLLIAGLVMSSVTGCSNSPRVIAATRAQKLTSDVHPDGIAPAQTDRGPSIANVTASTYAKDDVWLIVTIRGADAEFAKPEIIFSSVSADGKDCPCLSADPKAQVMMFAVPKAAQRFSLSLGSAGQKVIGFVPDTDIQTSVKSPSPLY